MILFKYIKKYSFCGVKIIIINEIFLEYSSNVTLLYTNYRNKYVLTLSSKKLLKMCFFISNWPYAPPLKRHK